MNLLFKFLQLPKERKSLIIKAIVLLLAIKLGCYFLSFKTICRIIQKKTVTKSKTDIKTLKHDVIWSIEAASNHLPFTKTCLIKALAAQILLSNYGYQSNIKIGITKSKNDLLDAHAWIESSGDIIMGNTDKLSEYKELELIKS